MTGRLRRLAAPLGVGLVAACGCAVLWAVDPNEPGHYPVCPTRMLFGVDCPGCGMLRGTHALLHGDVAAAADFNVLLLVAVPVSIWLWVRWLRASWSGRVPAAFAGRRQGFVITVGVIALMVFGVVRNFVPYLSTTA